MKPVAEFLAELHQLGIQLWREGDKLRYRATKGQLTSDLKEQLKKRKAEILQYLPSNRPANRPSIQPLSDRSQLPLSLAQKRLWFLNQLEGPSPTYNIPYALRLQGQLDFSILKTSLQTIVQRHEILRSQYYTVADQPMERLADCSFMEIFTELLADALPEPDPAIAKNHQGHNIPPAVHAFLWQQAQHPFDLAEDCLIRFHLIQLDPQDHILQITLHHIIADGWSMGILLREWVQLYTAAYQGVDANLSPLPIQYADYAHWQQQWLEEQVLLEQLNYWKQKLADVPPLLEMPTDFPRPPIQTYRGTTEKLVLSSELTTQLTELSHQQKTTLFITLLTAFQILLYRHSGQPDVLVGSPIANRNQAEVESLIGFFVNTLVLRGNLHDNPTFVEFLQQIRETALEAYTHQDMPFERLVAELHPQRTLSYSPLFQVMFVYHPEPPIPTLDLPELKVTALDIDIEASKFDLNLHLWPEKGQIIGKLYYNTDLFSVKTIRWLLSHFKTLLTDIVTYPHRSIDALQLLSEAERHPHAGNDLYPTQPFSYFERAEIEQSIPERFVNMVHQYTDYVAIKMADREITYGELNRWVNQVTAALLAATGQSKINNREQRIALLFDHDIEMIVAMLAVLKAGKAYIPLDPYYPSERLRFIIEDAQVHALLTHENFLVDATKLVKQRRLPLLNIHLLNTGLSTEEPNISYSPHAMAYVLYTSGSTGQPKGVVQTHRNILHFIRNYTNNLHIRSADRLSLLSSYSFDAAVMAIFGSLLNGATLCPFNIKMQGLEGLAQWMEEQEISIYHSTPTVYRHFLQHVEKEKQFNQVRLVVLGGEEVHRYDFEAFKQHFPSDCFFINGFGPTESTVTLQYLMHHDSQLQRNAVPIGYPVEETKVLLMNAEGQQTQIFGELVIQSEFVALEYWQRPELNAAKFFPVSEQPKVRRYHTGDMARLRPDGSLEFVGRNDFQIKIRGFRVELGEIEALLTEHPQVKEAAVVMREDIPSDRRLVAYVVPAELIPEFLPYEMSCLIEYGENSCVLPTVSLSLESVCLTKESFPQDLQIGDPVKVCLTLPHDNETYWLAGKVRQCPQAGFGVSFEADVETQMHLQKSIDILMERGDILMHIQQTLQPILREFLRTHLPDYMLPSIFIVLKTLPLTPTGKLNRRALPPPYYGHLENSYVAPRTEAEKQLIEIWQTLLNTQPIGIHDNFFNLGGHSLLMISLIGQIEKAFGERLSLTTLFQSPTVAELAQRLTGETHRYLPPSIIALQPHGDKIPFFCVAGAGGGVHWFNELANELAPDQPFFALEPLGLEPLPQDNSRSRSQLQAAGFIEAMKQIQPHGPYYLGGYSYGGIVAYEMACQLHEMGDEVELLVFLDTWNPIAPVRFYIRWLRWLRYFYYLPWQYKGEFLYAEWQHWLLNVRKFWLSLFYGQWETFKLRQQDVANWRYNLKPYQGNAQVVLLQSTQPHFLTPKPPGYGWHELIPKELEIHKIPGDHYTFMGQSNAGLLAKKIKKYLSKPPNS